VQRPQRVAALRVHGLLLALQLAAGEARAHVVHVVHVVHLVQAAAAHAPPRAAQVRLHQGVARARLHRAAVRAGAVRWWHAPAGAAGRALGLWV
jgi:hypothetical protein